MTFKDDMRKKTGEFLTKSQEMFEKIFAQATSELKIRRKPKPAFQKPVPAPSPEASRIKEERPKAARKPEKAAVAYKTSEKVKASPQLKPKVKASPRKGSRVLRTSLLFLLLLILAGFAANHFAIIDFGVIADFLGLTPKPVVQAPVPRKKEVKPAQAHKKTATPQTAPVEQVPSGTSKEEKLVQLETPTTVAPLKEETPLVEEKTPPAPATDQPKPVEIAAKQESKPAPAQTELLEKPTVSAISPSKPSTPQYPYSVYLGSFKAPEAVKKALSDYQEKGLAAYWVKVDLGDKGVWYRFFAGYFRTKEETEKYIRERSLQGATPGITKYATLIGIYGFDKEVEDQKRAIVSAGFYPYVIKQADGSTLVYSGAFDRKEYAEKERDALASKGIQSEVVER
jgi:hypothetical protein